MFENHWHLLNIVAHVLLWLPYNFPSNFLRIKQYARTYSNQKAIPGNSPYINSFYIKPLEHLKATRRRMFKAYPHNAGDMAIICSFPSPYSLPFGDKIIFISWGQDRPTIQFCQSKKIFILAMQIIFQGSSILSQSAQNCVFIQFISSQKEWLLLPTPCPLQGHCKHKLFQGLYSTVVWNVHALDFIKKKEGRLGPPVTCSIGLCASPYHTSNYLFNVTV